MAGKKQRQKPTGKKSPPTGTDADLNLATMLPLFSDEDKAREFLEAKLWPNGRICPHCGSSDSYVITAKPGSKRPARKGLYTCKKCRKQFTVRVGTLFESSHVPLSKWLMAIHLMTSSKKGMSSHQIAREVGITQKSAWFVCHRIREAMKQDIVLNTLEGTVEVDEAYIGGKPRFPGISKRGRGTSKKPVVVLVERGGRAYSHPVDSVDAATLKGTVKALVHPSATVMTDELSSYGGLAEDFKGGHFTVNHSRKEYVRREQCGDVFVTTNTAESFFAIFKRGHYGIYHQLSKHHLHRYCDEYGFRWTQRKVTDGERMVEAIQGAAGKRLMYR